MKQLAIFIIFLIPVALLAQKLPTIAPLSEEYMQYKEERKKSTTADTQSTGYIPIPIRLNFEIAKEQSKLKSTAGLPSRYDLREEGLVTSVKNQGGGNNGGNCWAFTAMGAIESQWLKSGLDTFDLSEQNLASCHGYEWKYGEGGNDLLAMAYLSRLGGPLLETDDPYTPDDTSTFMCTQGIKPVAYVPEAKWLPRDERSIKQALMDYGALSVSMRWNSASYYEENGYTYYYSGNRPCNHAVLLVGWDDNKETPVGTGAWIIKNQWDTTWADKGYFYIAYEDDKTMTTVAYYPSRNNTDDIHKIYMYDQLGPVTKTGFNNETCYGLTKFVANGNELVIKVGTFVAASNSIIDIDIYDDKNGDMLSNLTGSAKKQICKIPGFYTFDVAANVTDDFYVKVKYYSPGESYPMPIEALIDSSYAIPIIENGVNWISNKGQIWTPVGDTVEGEKETEIGYNYDLCIRAYTDTSGGVVAFFTADKRNICANTTVTFTDQSQDSITSYTWDFGEGAQPAAANTKGPHEVLYTTTGTKNIKLIIEGPGGADTLIKNNYIEVSNNLDIFLPKSTMLIPLGDSDTLMAYGADTYTWIPTTGLDTNSGNNLKITPVATGEYKYYVLAEQGNCSAHDSVKISVKVTPANDDVCNADTIGFGYHKANNINATAEENEVFPPHIDCETDSSWCDEYLDNTISLKHSVWFLFIAEDTMQVSFNTADVINSGKEFDTQIAIYKADSCDCLVDTSSSNYEFIAANDDHYGHEKHYAAALELIELTPGNYWIQVDGSGGDQQGRFILTVWGAPLNIRKSIGTETSLKIYPNPNKGMFSILYDHASENEIILRIIDLSGQVVYQDIFKNPAHPFEQQLNIEQFNKGIYIIQAIGNEQVITKKFVVE